MSQLNNRACCKKYANRLEFLFLLGYTAPVAGLAQLVEHFIRNEGVASSSLVAGTRISASFADFLMQKNAYKFIQKKLALTVPIADVCIIKYATIALSCMTLRRMAL